MDTIWQPKVHSASLHDFFASLLRPLFKVMTHGAVWYKLFAEFVTAGSHILAFWQEFSSRAKSIVMQIFIVTLIFLLFSDQILGGGL